MHRTALAAALAAVAALAIPFAPVVAQDSGSGDGGTGSSAPASPGSDDRVDTNVLDTTAEAKTFTKLVAAVEAAGLADELRGAGPITLFAPTDEAFEALPDGFVDSLLDAAMHDDLIALLSYHIVPEKLTSEDLAALVDGIGPETATIPTVDGHTLVVESQVGVTIDGATIVRPDMESTNGTVHGIDTVLLPDAS